MAQSLSTISRHIYCPISDFKNENVVQLLVQVLPEIGTDGGEVSERITKLDTNSFSDFISENSSRILIGFWFKFNAVESYQLCTDMIDSFIGIFEQLRQTLNMVISAQLKLMRTNDAAFDHSVANPTRDVFTHFLDSFDDAVRKKKKKEKGDIAIATIVVKHILPSLDANSSPSIQFAPLSNPPLVWNF
jgi:hypothetical protein